MIGPTLHNVLCTGNHLRLSLLPGLLQNRKRHKIPSVQTQWCEQCKVGEPIVAAVEGSQLFHGGQGCQVLNAYLTNIPWRNPGSWANSCGRRGMVPFGPFQDSTLCCRASSSSQVSSKSSGGSRSQMRQDRSSDAARVSLASPMRRRAC